MYFYWFLIYILNNNAQFLFGVPFGVLLKKQNKN